MIKRSLRVTGDKGQGGKWYKLLHYALVLAVFGITGILSVLISRYLLKGVLNLEGEVWSGPWSYRVAYLLLIPPLYSATLVMVGTLFGKYTYFRRHVLRPWSYLLRRLTRSTGVRTNDGDAI